MNHDQLYKDIGLRKINQFLNPNIVMDTEMFFPKGSELLWFKLSDLAISPNTSIGYLSNVKKPAVVTKFEYSSPIGKINAKHSLVKQIINKMKKKNTDVKFIPVGVRSLKVPKNTLVIYNYGVITAVNKYVANPMVEYYKWRNAFKTMTDSFNNLAHNGRHTYVLIELPSNLPTRSKFETYSSIENHKVLDYFPTYKHLTILEFYKLLTPRLFKDSLFGSIKNSTLENITFIFSFNNKLTLLNLKTLMSTVKEYDVKTNIQDNDSKTIRKLFLIYIKSIMVNGAMSIGELRNSKNVINTIDITKLTDNDDSDIKKVDVNEVLDDLEGDKDINYDKLSDNLMDDDESNELMDDIESTYKSINDVINEKMDSNKTLRERAEKLKESKLITKKEKDDIDDALNYQETAKSPYGNEATLKEMLSITEADLEVPKDLGDIPDINIIENKDMLKDPIKAMDKHYINTVYKKDILATIYSIQNNDIVIKDHTVETTESILGGVETHTIMVKPLSGKPSKIFFNLPVIKENGEFTVSGNTYKLRKQRTDKPIRKIDYNKVALTSYFGKSFVTKADMKKDDVGFWFRKKLIEASETNKKIKNVVLMPVKLMDFKLPNLYSEISRYVKMFKLGNIKYSFDYKNRAELKSDIKTLLSILEEKDKYVLVGRVENSMELIYMDFDNNLYIGSGSKKKPMDDIYTQLNINKNNMPIEAAFIKIFKKRIPVAILLSYYIGFTNLLKLLKAKHVIMDRTKRYQLTDDEYMLTFKDKKVILNKSDKLATMILAGIAGLRNYTKDIELVLLNKREYFPVLFNSMNLPPLYVTEIKLMENMFVDPVTKSILNTMKEPETFKGLLIKASELLLDNNYIDPNNANGMLIKGYERVSGMLYTELVKSIREYENKNVFSKSKLIMDPYAVWRDINNDSTSALVDNLNPIASLKQNEDVTYLGSGGRSKESMSMDTRVIHSSEIGVISEGVKDSGDVGVSAYMSANPKIKTVRGMVDTEKKDLKPDNYLSTSGLLAPASTSDDPKRLNFVNIQNSHSIAINEMRVPPVRTGYEAVLPYRLDENYCYMAEDDGVVESVSKSNIKIIFKNGKKKTVKLGSWFTKEEAGVSYEHILITDLDKGDKFKKGNTISYDKHFFEPDIFDKTRVIYKTGNTIKVALMENTETYEDSCTISKKISDKLGTSIIKSKSFIVKASDNIINLLNIGDKVEPNDLLFTISDNLVPGTDSKLDKESLSILQNIKNRSPKAKMRGVITKIVVYYNCEKEDMSKSIKEITDKTDKDLGKDNLNSSLTGKVNSSYSIKGKPLTEGNVEIKISIKDNVGMGIGDKAVIANQLKSTVGDVYDYDIKTESGRDVEALFSTRSIAARIVNSPNIIGTTNTVLDLLRDRAVEMYFK